jgi:hypothetical protein
MSTKNYKISCFSIIYEAEIFIQGLIDNILEQEDFEKIEFIFINPKSPDKSKNILLPYLEKYINFKLIDLDLDPGLYECWNIAVKESSSDIITNWNPDDRRTVDSIKSLANTLILSPSQIQLPPNTSLLKIFLQSLILFVYILSKYFYFYFYYRVFIHFLSIFKDGPFSFWGTIFITHFDLVPYKGSVHPFSLRFFVWYFLNLNNLGFSSVHRDRKCSYLSLTSQ